ncbi:hypothetical protein [Nonomuraea sp. NPDC049158]|uniref:hypothetical protein n=1 Tax=Nonomuraea sp. NPDC049158 TaxID=3155649 RepID=UPI00340FB13D
MSKSFSPNDDTAVRALVIAYGGMTAARDLARTAYYRALAALGTLADGAGRRALFHVAASSWREEPW